MAGKEDHRQPLCQAARGQHVEEFGAADIRHAHIKQHTVALGVEFTGLVQRCQEGGAAVVSGCSDSA
ncbi:hypothetical protein D9M68_979320 [compost metagenome]